MKRRQAPSFWEKVFTRQERIALAFCAAVFLCGFVILVFKPVGNPRPVSWKVLQVHINRASPEELAALPDIGPVLAKRIIADRKRNGYFLTSSDLSRVKGMTSKTLKKLEGYIQFD